MIITKKTPDQANAPDSSTIEAFSLAGRFDAHEADEFSSAIDGTLDAGASSIDIALTDVEFIDSTALAQLVRVMKQCRERGGDVRLVSPSDPVRVILELTKLDAAFQII